jgi:DNA-binding MarR family transcriptional regulator
MRKTLRKSNTRAKLNGAAKRRNSKAAAAALRMATATTGSASSGTPLLRSGFLIHDVSRLRRTAYDQRLKPFNITRAQWWVLANLSRRNCDGISQIELARLLDVGKVTLGGLIDRLEQSGFVVRVPDKNDRRSKRIMRSPEGKALCDRMEVFAHGVSKEIMTGISDEEHRLFIKVLTKMKGNLIKMDAVPQSTPRSRDKNAAGGDTLGD